MTKELFFKMYYHSALQCQRETNIPALAILAQAALETAWGESAPRNMFFGIKAGPDWKGKRQLITTTEYFEDADQRKHPFSQVISIEQEKDSDGKIRYKWKVKDWFRAYDTAAESFVDHCHFLTENPRYNKAFETTDPERFIDAVTAAGYATSPKYAKLWKELMNSLRQFLPQTL